MVSVSVVYLYSLQLSMTFVNALYPMAEDRYTVKEVAARRFPNGRSVTSSLLQDAFSPRRVYTERINSRRVR